VIDSTNGKVYFEGLEEDKKDFIELCARSAVRLIDSKEDKSCSSFCLLPKLLQHHTTLLEFLQINYMGFLVTTNLEKLENYSPSSVL